MHSLYSNMFATTPKKEVKAKRLGGRVTVPMLTIPKRDNLAPSGLASLGL